MNTNAQAYAMETTEREIEKAYIDLGRMLQLGQSQNAVKQALGLAKLDSNRLWIYLRGYASRSLNYRETTPLLVVNALWNNWQQDNDDISFIGHAVLTLVNAPKGQSAVDFYDRSVKPA